MGKIVWKPSALMGPVPAALVTCGSLEHPLILTVAWTGIVCTQPPMTYISIRPERNSYPVIRDSGEFCINLTTRALSRAADYCGVKSGRDTDKFQRMSLTPAPASAVGCPILSESPLTLECRVKERRGLGSHDMFLAEIVAVDVEDSLLDAAGKLHLERAGLLAYAHGDYFALGEKLGGFGWSVRKKPLHSKGNRRGQPKAAPKKRPRDQENH